MGSERRLRAASRISEDGERSPRGRLVRICRAYEQGSVLLFETTLPDRPLNVFPSLVIIQLNDPSLDLIFGAVMLQLVPSPGGPTWAEALTPDRTPPPSSESPHLVARKPVSLSIETSGSINRKASTRSNPPSPSPKIPLPPLPSRRQTTEIAPMATIPGMELRPQSEQCTSSTAPPSILKKSPSSSDHGVAPLVVEPVASTYTSPTPDSTPKPSQPERPAKSTRRFSLFGGSKSKSDAGDDKSKDKGKGVDGRKDKAAEKDKAISPPKKSKHAPPAVPKSTSTPKSRALTAEDIQLRKNTEANKVSPAASPSVSPTASLSRLPPVPSRSASTISSSATAPAPMIKSISSLSFAESIDSTTTASTSGSSSESAVKPEKKRKLLLKKQSSVSSATPASASMVDLPITMHKAGISEAESYLAFDIHPTMPAALSSTGDLHGRLEKAQEAIAATAQLGIATPRPPRITWGDGRRKSMVVVPSDDGDKKSRRFSLFGSRKPSKEERFPPLPPSPALLDESFSPKRRSMTRSSSQGSLFDPERPSSQIFLDDRDFPDFSQFRAPHQMKSPPKNNASLSTSTSTSPITSPRQPSWMSPAASFSRNSRGMSTPPILEGDDEQSFLDDPKTARRMGSMLAKVAESDPGHGGLEIDEPPPLPRTALTRQYSLADNAKSKDFDLTRKIDPPAPTPPPPASSQLPTVTTPPLSPQQQRSSAIGSAPDVIVGPISPDATPVKSVASGADYKTRPDSTISFGAEAGPALSMLFSNGAADSSPIGSNFSTSPPAPKRALPPPPPSPTTSAGPSSSSHHDHEDQRPPILTVRAVFAALSPTEHHTTGRVLDILMGFIDRERERSIMLDRKKGWGDAERTKVGWIISEVEAEVSSPSPFRHPYTAKLTEPPLFDGHSCFRPTRT